MVRVAPHVIWRQNVPGSQVDGWMEKFMAIAVGFFQNATLKGLLTVMYGTNFTEDLFIDWLQEVPK